MPRDLPPQMRGTRRQVDGRRFDVAVPHHLGQGEDVAATLEHEGSERVPERVDVELHARRLDEVSDHPLQPFGGELELPLPRPSGVLPFNISSSSLSTSSGRATVRLLRAESLRHGHLHRNRYSPLTTR